jgi:Aldehyde dehydrogenase family
MVLSFSVGSRRSPCGSPAATRLPPSGGTRLLTMRQPVGPVYAITPWNFPLAMGTRKIGPALAAGCTVVIKPRRPHPADDLGAGGDPDGGRPGGRGCQCDHDVDIEQGVCSDNRRPAPAQADLHRLDIGGPEADPAVRSAGTQDLHELGGNAPFLIFADANLDAAVEGAMLAKMRNIGEACTAANRFIVHESMAEEFAARFAAKMSELTVGPGIEDGVKVGPLIDQTAIDKVTELVGDAVDHGADVLTGGERIDRPVTSTGPPSCPRCPSRRGSSGRRSSARWRRSPPSGTTTKVWTGERHRVRIGRVRVHSEPDPGNPRRRRTADGHGGHQPGRRVQPSSPVRRRQGLRAGA